MTERMEIGVMRGLVQLLEAGEMVSVKARDKTRTLEVTEPARHVRDMYQTTGLYVGLAGYGTHYTLCVPDAEKERVRLRYPQNPGLGERVSRLERNEEDRRNPDVDEMAGTAGSKLVSDTTAADIIDCDPEDGFR